MKNVLYFIFILSLGLNNKSVYGQFDFGDAPDPTYPTLNVNNGANHLVTGLSLGYQIDGEGDGQPGIFASGDDGAGAVDDEDGIFLTSWLIPGQTATIVVNSSGAGFLDGWIDFQANGNWTDPGDQVFTSQAVIPGFNVLNISVPITASTGVNTYGRFRLSLLGGFQPTGNAPDGEVEDYMIILGAPTVGDTIMDIDAGLSFTQNEVSMTFESTTGNIISAYNDNPFPGGNGIGISYSSDNGQSWSAQQLSIPTNPYTGISLLDCFDPTITHDDAGNIYVAHIATDYNWGTGPVSGLYVHKSSNGGVNWGNPKTVDYDSSSVSSPDSNYRFNDRCQIVSDCNSSSTYYNNVYVTWIKDRGWNMTSPWSDIYVSVSSDGGATFSNSVQINTVSNDMGNMPVPAIASNGDVYVLWMDYNVITGGNGVLMLDKSTDGGATWGGDAVIDTITLPPIHLNMGSDVQAKGAAVIRTHPSNPNELYIVYAADPDALGADEGNIFFIKSTNGGTSWSSPLKLNDDITTNDQVLPWMEVKANGVIDVVWYDRRNDGNDLLWDVYATNSADGGQSFATNIKVNVSNFSTPQTSSGNWFGEYLGLAVSDSMAYIGFTSSAIDIKGDVVFASFKNPSIPGLILDESQLNRDIKVYPNPTTDILNIEIQRNFSTGSLSVQDATGKIILSKNDLSNEVEIVDLSSCSKGIYFIEIKIDNEVKVLKIVKR